MTFTKAMRALQKGKTVRRAEWGCQSDRLKARANYLCWAWDDIHYYSLRFEDVFATDWEIVE